MNDSEVTKPIDLEEYRVWCEFEARRQAERIQDAKALLEREGFLVIDGTEVA
jgi:hypothetical protein